MKHVIIEGTDKTGKNKLISWLCSISDNYTVRHFVFPVGNSKKELVEFQKKDFENEFKLSLFRFKPNYTPQKNDMYIWNRSHIGEYVYGQLYRNYDTSWIFELEKHFHFDKMNDIYLILLYSDKDFLIKNDDMKSFSSKNPQNWEKETKLFFESVEKSHIKNKLFVKINEGDKFLFEDTKSKVTNFLNLEI